MLRATIAILLTALLASCKHPLIIVGEGDIVDLNESGFGCTLEQFQANDAACENDVTGDYFVNYAGVPREGWRFSHWTGSCGKDSIFPNCRFDMPGSLVGFWDANFPGLGGGTLTAVFEQSAAANSKQYEFSGSLAETNGGAPLVQYDYTNPDDILNSGGTYRDYRSEALDFEQADGQTFLSLEAREYLGFEPGILSDIDLDQAASIALRFKFDVTSRSNTSPCCPNELFRHVIGTNRGDPRAAGFAITVISEDEDTYALYLVSGDGQQFIDNDQSRKGGLGLRLLELEEDKWVSLKLFLYFQDPNNSRLTIFVNGAPFNLVYSDTERADPAAIKSYLEGNAPTDGSPLPGLNLGVTEPSLFIGAYPDMVPYNAEFTLSVDDLTIEAPLVGASTQALVSALELLRSHLEGDTQSDTAREQALVTITEGFAGKWDAIRPTAMAFFDSFEASQGVLFYDNRLISPIEFSPEAKVVYFLQQWLLDNRFQNSFDSGDAGIAFADADRFPGPVRASAARVAGAVGIDGSYATDPGFRLNDQDTVIRPTGYYVAPGEVVTVTVPDAVTAAGLKLRVGFQRADMEAGLWDVFNRFPRISSLYALDQRTVSVANPFGGGLYVEVPDGTDLGKFTLQVSGAVKMPMYSELDLVGHSSDLAAFQAEADAWNVPWFEMHGRNFSATLPMNEVRLYPDPSYLLARYEAAFDEISAMAGRPKERIRAEWSSYDRHVTYRGTALAASYPSYPDNDIGEVGEHWANTPHWGSPHLMVRDDFIFDRDVNNAEQGYDPRARNHTLWHEWGHLHNLPTLQWQEQESNVHLLAAVVYNRVVGMDIDQALAWSGFQHFTRDQAAIDTMLSPNWQQGDRLTEATFNGVWDNELRYQTRSWARIVEIAALYGWEAVGSIHGAFYERGRAQGDAIDYGLTDDEFIETASDALQLNLSPLFDFWGVPPSAELADRLGRYAVPAEFETRLMHYLSLVPADNTAFEAVYLDFSPTNGGAVGERLGFYLQNYDSETAATISARIEGILCTYYSCPE